MVASALNSLAVACLLALVVAAGAARTEPGADEQLMCHSNNGWSDHLCKDVCKTSGFSRYGYSVPNAATGSLARCCCCPRDSTHGCIDVDA